MKEKLQFVLKFLVHHRSPNTILRSVVPLGNGDSLFDIAYPLTPILDRQALNQRGNARIMMAYPSLIDCGLEDGTSLLELSADEGDRGKVLHFHERQDCVQQAVLGKDGIGAVGIVDGRVDGDNGLAGHGDKGKW